MDNLMASASTLSGIAGSIVAVIGGGYALYRWLKSQPFKKRLSIFSNPSSLENDLLKVRGRTLNFDTILDFSVWNELSHRIASETEYKEILCQPARDLNNKPLPLYAPQKGGGLDSFVRLVVSVKDSSRLKFSHGGTGIIYVLLKGKFDVEVRNYAGPIIEFTLREVT